MAYYLIKKKQVDNNNKTWFPDWTSWTDLRKAGWIEIKYLGCGWDFNFLRNLRRTRGGWLRICYLTYIGTISSWKKSVVPNCSGMQSFTFLIWIKCWRQWYNQNWSKNNRSIDEIISLRLDARSGKIKNRVVLFHNERSADVPIGTLR